MTRLTAMERERVAIVAEIETLQSAPGEQTAAIKVMRLSDWMALAEFEQALADYFNEPRPAAELADYRAKREAVKKPRDEVVPVLHHVKFKAKGERHSVPYGAHG
jgi:hypothetical protein